MSDFNRIEDKKIDIDVNVQESFSFNVDIAGEDDLRKYRKRPESLFSYWKLSVAILCAGLALFVIIKAYNKYEERKEMKAAIEMLNQLNREAEREIKRIMNPPKPVAKPAIKKQSSPQKTSQPATTEPTPAQEEFYQDSDGVWRNRDSGQSKTTTNSEFFKAPATEELYQDNDGVWRNRVVTQPGVESVTADGLNLIHKQYMDAITPHFEERQRENQEKLRRSKAELQRFEEERDRKRQAQKDYEVWLKKIDDPSSYERFDPAKAGEVKSEWEYFDDPRSKK